MRKSIIFRNRYYNSLSLLRPIERLEAVEAILEYAFTGKKEKIDKLSSEALAATVVLICNSIDEDYDRYMERKESRYED